VRRSDAVVLLCPNYNDALSANLRALIKIDKRLDEVAKRMKKTLYEGEGAQHDEL